MSVNVPATANRIYQEFRTDAIKEFDAALLLWQNYGMEIPSNSRSTLHAWLANQALVREWLGERIARNMGARTWEVFNKKYELTFEFERDQMEDDLSGLVSNALMQARQMGEKFARHEDLLMAATLEAGLTSLCFDGQYFFDTDHPVDLEGVTSGTFINKMTSSALTYANYQAADLLMDSFKNVDGTPMVTPGSGRILMVPPALKVKAQQIVENPYQTPGVAIGLTGTSGESPNPYFGSARVLVNPYLTSTTRWFLLAKSGNVAPIMLQRRRPLETQEIGEGSDLWFNEEKVKFGGSVRYNASYTLPQLAICADA